MKKKSKKSKTQYSNWEFFFFNWSNKIVDEYSKLKIIDSKSILKSMKKSRSKKEYSLKYLKEKKYLN